MLNYDINIGDKEREFEEYGGSGNHSLKNPFPGLRPFSIDECHLFFGREGQVDEILEKLAENHFVTVMGYSGSGKSSLMYCGLIPTLHGGFLTDAGPNWNVVIARPGKSPIDNLAESILKISRDFKDQSVEERVANKAIIASMLRSDTEGLIKAVEGIQRESGKNTLVLLDQFEELFTYKADDENGESNIQEAKVYVNLLLEACRNANSPVYLALTMRSDYVGECAVFPGLTQMINQSNYLVPQMTREEKRIAIEGPVAVGGGKISNRLVKRLLNEIGDNQDQLPILQHALMRTWDYWVQSREEDEPLDLRHYHAVGKITQALSQHANEAYEELSSRERDIAEILFKSLTERANNNFGMRRSVRLGLVSELAGVNDSEVIEVIEKFRQPGRSFLMPSSNVPLNTDSTIEISHESLMRIWTRLKTWVDEEYESAQMYRRLSDAAAMYQVGKTSLWRPPDLQLALNWQNKQKPTRAWAKRYDEAFERAKVFLDTSRITYEAEQKNQEMLQKRLLKRTKMVAVVLGVFAVICIFLFIFGITRNIEANKQRDIALTNEREANEQRDIALANEQEANRQRAEANRQAELARKAEETAKEALYEAEEQRNYAQKQFIIAQEQRNIAEDERHIAQEARNQAEKEYVRAETNYNRAQKLLYQSVAQSMAVKSLSIEDSDLKGLLAQQAYTFNKRYEGRIYDPYIYNALYSALAQLKGKSYNTINAGQRNSIRSLVFKNNSNTFYSTGTEGKIVESSLFSKGNSSIIDSHPYPNRVLAIDKGNQWLVSASDSAYLKVYNVNQPDQINKITGHSRFVNDIVFLPNQSVFISAGSDNQLRLNDISRFEGTLLKTTEEPFKVIAISPDGKYLASGTLSGQVSITNLSTLEEKVCFKQTGNPVHALSYSPDGLSLAIGDEAGNVKIWDISNEKITREFAAHKGRVSALEFSPNGKLLASASLDKTIQMWVIDKLDELPIKMTDNDAYVWDIKFSPNSDYLLAACGDGELRVWPTRPELMAKNMCNELSRNMSDEEWKTYVGNDIQFENSCINLLLNNY